MLIIYYLYSIFVFNGRYTMIICYIHKSTIFVIFLYFLWLLIVSIYFISFVLVIDGLYMGYVMELIFYKVVVFSNVLVI